MTYFTKYLPVEGEIKDGDMGLFLGVVQPMTHLILHSAQSNNRHIKKVKLFLCSRELFVGDIVDTHAHQLQGKIHSIENGKVWLDPNINGVSGKAFSEWFDYNIIKVIGEISTDALSYVKEGDIDEEKLGYYEYKHHEFPMVGTQPFNKQDWEANNAKPEEYRCIVHVIGPCTHFH